MPQEQAPPQLPNVDIEDEPLFTGSQTIEDAYAQKLVVETFHEYERFRQSNHDNRWSGHDALYFGYLPLKAWDGTKVPRASLSQPVAFSQIESAAPMISQAIFPSEDWFGAEPEPGADPHEAQQIKSHLQYRLDHDKDDLGRTARRELEHAFKSILTYGNGGIATQWDPVKKKPFVEWVDLRDIYISPGLTTPSLNDGAPVIWRKHFTVEELDDMRGVPGMNIPPKSMLVHFSRRPTHTDGDRTKTMQEALRGVNYVPGMDDYAKNPADRTVEVFMYYSKSRIIWVLGRDWCAYNGPNPYGFLPFDFAPCFTVISRFYAMGYCDVLEGPQRYIEALYNARLDELSLSINPPRVKKLGSTTTPMQDRWAPGMVSSVNSPKDDWVVQFPNNATANIMSDIEFITDSASNVTGANSFMQGVPRAGNVNRTATGVSSQTQAGSSRLYYIVKNIEDYLVIPMLYKMYKLIQFHSDVTDTLPALGQDSQQVQVGAKAFQAPIRFKMVAASQMLTRDKLMQVLPFLTQYYLNGSFLQQLHGAGKTVDFDEFQRALMDATGTGTQYKFIRDLTQQEQQQMNAPPPEAQMQQQQKQQELQTRKQIADDKNQNQIHLELIKKQPDPHEIEQKRQEMAMEADSQRQEMAHEMEKHRLEMATRQDEMRMKSQEAQQDMALKLLQGQNDLGMQQQEAQFAQQNQAQTLQHTEEAHRQGVQHQEEAHKAALAQGGEKHKSGLKQGQEKHKAGLKQKEASAQQQLELKALMAQEQMQAPGQQGSGAE